MKLMNSIAVMMLFVACNPVSKDQLKKMIIDNPDIITEAIEKNPNKFITALNTAVKSAQEKEMKDRETEEKTKLEEAYNNPLVAEIRSDELIRGTKGAPIVLVEYSDFECPFCSRGYATVVELLEKYKGKISFIYKHLPLNFHPQAEISARYYEAIRLQDEQKAIKFHDEIYKNQRKLQGGEKFLKELAAQVKADMGKLAKDINSEAVTKRIEQDRAEAEKFGFQGTPGFIINGVPVKGAYPLSHFEDIINELTKRGKLKM
jgi:protein-disulfide isomerase